MNYTNDDLSLYVAGEYDGDIDALENALESDRSLRQRLSLEARLDMDLRQLGELAEFCPACQDLSKVIRCMACGAARSAGGFVVEDVLVQNAHGRLYRARDADGRRVALKELAFVQTPSASVLSAFEREAKYLRSLKHPSIPAFVANFQEGQGVGTRLYLAQEFIEGQSLQARLAEHRFTEHEAKNIAVQVLDVLVYLQSLSPAVIHRDIKPANLIYKPDGSIALVDFGAAHDQGDTMATAVGTFGYMPLEQLAGQMDSTTDTYALGATLLHLLTRKEPWRLFESNDFSGANISKPMRLFLGQLCSKKTSKRFPSALSAKAALDKMRSTSKISPKSKKRKERWVPLFALAGLSFSGAGYALQHKFNSPSESNPPSLNESHFEPGECAPSDPLCQLPNPQCAPDDPLCLNDIRSELSALGYLNQFRLERNSFDALGDAKDNLPIFQLDYPLPYHPNFPQWSNAKSVQEALDVATNNRVNTVLSSEHSNTPIDGAINEESWIESLDNILGQAKLRRSYDPFANILVLHPEHHVPALSKWKNTRNRKRLPFKDKIVSLNFRDHAVSQTLLNLAVVGTVPLQFPTKMEEKVTTRMTEVPWNLAFESVLVAAGYWYTYSEEEEAFIVHPLE